MTRVAPRIVNSVSCVKRIDHESHFSWQAQYLLKLEADSCCSAHCLLLFWWCLGVLVCWGDLIEDELGWLLPKMAEG